MRRPPRNPPGGLLCAVLVAACGGAAGSSDTAPTEATSGTSTPGATTPDTPTTDTPTTGSPTSDASATTTGTTGTTIDPSSEASTDATTAGTTTDASTTDTTTTGALVPDLPPPCEPTTCRALGATCGALPDGCGGELACGECVEPDTCGGGVDNACGRACVPVRVILFDLGETLVESDGGDQFVERPGVPAMIAELKGLGVRVGLITNVPEGYTLQDLEGLLVNPAFLDEFELVLLSSEAAAPPKPDAAIFAEAHGLLVDPPPIGEVAYVSENLAEIADKELMPTQGARAAGMLGVHLSDAPPSPLADHTIPPDPADALVTLFETEWLPCDERP